MFYLTFDLHFQFSINNNYNLHVNFDKTAWFERGCQLSSVVKPNPNSRIKLLSQSQTVAKPEPK